jgi:hypothetical protein
MGPATVRIDQPAVCLCAEHARQLAADLLRLLEETEGPRKDQP